MTARKPWLVCNLCGALAVTRYINGPRCPDHTPAAFAGRPEPPVPDPASTALGLLHGPSLSERRRRPAQHKRFRRASKVVDGKRFYTPADIDVARVRAVTTRLGRELAARSR